MRDRLTFSFDTHAEMPKQREVETFITPDMQPREFKQISEADLEAGNEMMVSEIATRQVEKGVDAHGETLIDMVPEFNHAKKIRVKILNPHHNTDGMDVVLYEESHPIFKQKPGSKADKPEYELGQDGYPVPEIDAATKNFKYTAPRTVWGSRSRFTTYVQNTGEITAEKRRAAEQAAEAESRKKAA